MYLRLGFERRARHEYTTLTSVATDGAAVETGAVSFPVSFPRGGMTTGGATTGPSFDKSLKGVPSLKGLPTQVVSAMTSIRSIQRPTGFGCPTARWDGMPFRLWLCDDVARRTELCAEVSALAVELFGVHRIGGQLHTRRLISCGRKRRVSVAKNVREHAGLSGTGVARPKRQMALQHRPYHFVDCVVAHVDVLRAVRVHFDPKECAVVRADRSHAPALAEPSSPMTGIAHIRFRFAPFEPLGGGAAARFGRCTAPAVHARNRQEIEYIGDWSPSSPRT